MKNLQEFDTLEEAKAFYTAEHQMLSASVVSVELYLKDLYEYFLDSEFTIRRLVADTVKRGAPFDLQENSEDGIMNIYMFNHMIDIEAEETHKANLILLRDSLIAQANVKTYLFANVTTEQFAACKDAYSLEHKQEEDKVWNRQSRLRVTLLEDLYEPRMVTLFYTDDFFKHKNVGRPTLMHKAGEHLIDLKGVTQTGTLHINFGVKFSADCELV